MTGWKTSCRNTAVVKFAMVKGHGWIVPDEGDPMRLGAGDVAVTRAPDHYTVTDDPASPIDVVIPTLDSEMLSFIALESRLRELGIGTFLPSREHFELRSKSHLAELAARFGGSVKTAY